MHLIDRAFVQRLKGNRLAWFDPETCCDQVVKFRRGMNPKDSLIRAYQLLRQKVYRYVIQDIVKTNKQAGDLI